MNDNKKHDENPDPITGEPGAHPLGVAGGATGGAMAGAAIGAIGGPVGSVIGGAIGAVAGGLAGKGLAETVNPTEEAEYWRQNHASRPYFQSGRKYEDYNPAYQYGWESASRPEYHGRRFEDVESDLGRNWDKARGTARTEWNDMKHATRDAFERVQNRTAAGMTRASETTGVTGTTAAKKTDAVWEQAKGNWHQFKGAVKAKWNDLTDDELDQMNGERERIVGKIQERYGKAKWSEADIENELRRN
ncbi:MAG: CsbD family protein [Acidobacteriota bacterium]|nr:CsbD family protein [Acidobacteriota bacterium]